MLRAASHEKRMRILGALKEGPLGYTELMQKAGFGTGESGRFAYHLKRLEKAGLVSKDVDGRYVLTEAGRDFSEKLLAGHGYERAISPLFEDITDPWRYALGMLLLVFGGTAAVGDGLLFAAGIAGVKARVEIMGSIAYKPVNAQLALLLTAASLLASIRGMDLIRGSCKGDMAEKLVLGKFVTFVLARRGLLWRFIAVAAMCMVGSALAIAAPLLV